MLVIVYVPLAYMSMLIYVYVFCVEFRVGSTENEKNTV